MPKTRMSPLVAAAAALEAEMERFDEAARAVVKTPLQSRRSLETASQGLQAVAKCEATLAESLQELVKAISQARHAQEGRAQAVVDKAREIAQRRAELQTLLDRCNALGEDARVVTNLLQELPLGVDTPPDAAMLGKAADAQQRLMELVKAAEALNLSARDAGFVDIAKETDSLRQQLVSTSHKMERLLGSAGGTA